MTLFASTLYPQTNPTNPILLWAREVGIELAAEELKSPNASFVGAWVGGMQVRREHVDHARRVINPLAALSG